MNKLEQQLVEALKAYLDAQPLIGGNGMYSHAKQGCFIDDIAQTAGYGLELHQHGIMGTNMLFVPLKK